MTSEQDKRRRYGEHYTPVEVFRRFVLPEIRDHFRAYRWVDMFAGEGNLVLPMLEQIPDNERTEFFSKHIFLYDVKAEAVEKARERAVMLGVAEDEARRNIRKHNSLYRYPVRGNGACPLPWFHITNPPYLYKGYVSKNPKLLGYRKLLSKGNCVQDLYQIAMHNDLKNKIQRMIYIIPANFFFGYSISNKFRTLFLEHYYVRRAVILEDGVFEHTGTNTALCVFERKDKPCHEALSFPLLKTGRVDAIRTVTLYPESKYRAGTELDEFTERNKAKLPLEVKLYLNKEEVAQNAGDVRVTVLDASTKIGRRYGTVEINVNMRLADKIRSNILFLRPIDSGTALDRAGLYSTRESYGADGVLVTHKPYRTHPIQLFFEPRLSSEDQLLLRDYFHVLLEHFRKKLGSDFLTTFRYAKTGYTRKYLGIGHTKRIIGTFPLLDMDESEREALRSVVARGDGEELVRFIERP